MKYLRAKIIIIIKIMELIIRQSEFLTSFRSGESDLIALRSGIVLVEHSDLCLDWRVWPQTSHRYRILWRGRLALHDPRSWILEWLINDEVLLTKVLLPIRILNR